MTGRIALWCRKRLCRPVIFRAGVEIHANTNTSRKKKRVLPVISYTLSVGFLEKLFRPEEQKMSLLPPESVRGMMTLDRQKFNKTVKVSSLIVPVKSLTYIIKMLKSKYLLRMPKLGHVCELSEGDPDKTTHKMILFDPGKLKSVSEFTEDEKLALTSAGVDLSSFREIDVHLGYQNWNGAEIIQAIIPKGQETVAGFAAVGHIAHFNLRTEVLPWKNVIGQVTLDKNKYLRTVVNKLDSIDNTFRTFQMELLAGEENYITTIKENGHLFRFDFSKVYWNTRLGTEHQRIVDIVKKDDVVYDVFAGVGPFAVPMGKKKATVIANDLNPHSYDSLKNNMKLNHVSTVTCHNLDGRVFIRTVMKPHLEARWRECMETQASTNFHIVMNLPALAVEFIDAFIGLYPDIDDNLKESQWVTLPKVHCYCFEMAHNVHRDDVHQAVKDRVVNILGQSVAQDLTVRFVRDVSPKKDMMCASFSLTWTVLCQSEAEYGEPAAKQRKIEIQNDQV